MYKFFNHYIFVEKFYSKWALTIKETTMGTVTIIIDKHPNNKKINPG